MALTRVSSFPAVTGNPEVVLNVQGVWFVVVNVSGTKTIYWSADLTTWATTDDEATSGVSTGISLLQKAGSTWFLQ